MVRRHDGEISGTFPTRSAAVRSEEAEHGPTLTAHERARRRAFAKALAAMPDVGVDADFERVDAAGRSPHGKGGR